MIHYSFNIFIIYYFILVGKTELAKQVARYLHKDNKKVVIVINMTQWFNLIISLHLFICFFFGKPFVL